jgi:hypothetical protein
MSYPPNPADRPDPMDNAPPMRARVPEHVAAGQISTGVIVVTGATEFILDFVRNLPRPNIIVARVVLPHQVMPQFIEALSTNIALYRQRFHDLNNSPSGSTAIQSFSEANPVAFPPGSSLGTSSEAGSDKSSGPGSTSALGAIGDSPKPRPSDTPTSSLFGNPIDIHAGASIPKESGINKGESSSNAGEPSDSESLPPPPKPSITRHPSPQEVYDELKLKDELLSGSYSNAVMIGHGPHEFSFDFITNFYPQSAVSCRVFMAAGHVGRLLDSLKASWDQLKTRMG